MWKRRRLHDASLLRSPPTELQDWASRSIFLDPSLRTRDFVTSDFVEKRSQDETIILVTFLQKSSCQVIVIVSGGETSDMSFCRPFHASFEIHELLDFFVKVAQTLHIDEA